jgi:CPA1 family monovalent cation:H+ antiporter
MLMKLFSDKRGEFFAFVIEAYSAYLIGEEMHISGILTLITAIIATKAWIDIDIKQLENGENKKSKSFLKTMRLDTLATTTSKRLEYIYDMSKEFGYIAVVMIFFLLAEMADFEKLWHYKNEILIMFTLTTIIRALSMAKFAFWGNKLKSIKPVGLEGWFILTFSGMKGALSIILVHLIPDSFAHKELFEMVTVGVVMMSIFVYGTVLWTYFTFFKKEERANIFAQK